MQIMIPAAIMVFYILGIGIFSFQTRKKYLRNGSLKLGYFKTHDAQAYPVPEYIVRVGRHYDNQFQLPLLFLITCLMVTTNDVRTSIVTLSAWGFVLSRMVHTYYHLGSNDVLKRAMAFFTGWIMVIIMWLMIVSHHILSRVL